VMPVTVIMTMMTVTPWQADHRVTVIMIMMAAGPSTVTAAAGLPGTVTDDSVTQTIHDSAAR
jgi:hypothetical protein